MANSEKPLSFTWKTWSTWKNQSVLLGFARFYSVLLGFTWKNRSVLSSLSSVNSVLSNARGSVRRPRLMAKFQEALCAVNPVDAAMQKLALLRQGNRPVEAVRGHLQAPTSPMEYVCLTTPDKLRLADTPYIPPHRR